jgi:hypothetical protein
LTASATGLTSATTQFTISSSSGDFSIAGNLTVNGAINTGVIPQTQNNGTARMGHLNQQDANGSLRVQLGSGSNQFFSVNNQGLTSDLLYITNNGKVATSANGADRNVLDDGSGNMILTGAYKSIISSSTPGPHSAAGLKVDLWPDAHSDGIGMQNGGMWLKYGGIFDIYYDSGTTMNSMLHLDSTGILTINKIEMTCTAPYFSTWQGGSTPLEPYLWGLQYYGGQWHWTADGNTLQLGDSFIRFKDTAYPNNTVDIGIIRGPQEPEDPILWISRHLAVKKDFICGGAATVSQGALVLGSDWDATKLTGRMPQIYLAHSEGSPYPEDPTRDTLQIWRAGYVGFGNLSAGLIQGGCTKVVDAYGNTIGFAGSGDAFKVGDECYLVDINYANRIGIQGAQNRDEGGFRLGNNGPWLYRNGGYLRTDSPFISDYSITSSSLSGSGNRSVGANSTGTLIIYPSSLQYKENVEDLEDSSWIYGLRPVSFNYKDKVQYGREKNVGLIAEEVASLNPLFTCTDKDGKPDGVHYEWLSIPIIAELRKLRAEVDGLKTKVS